MTRSIVLVSSITLLLLAASFASAQSDVWLKDATDRVLEFYDGQSLLVIGELHGNVETPELVASLVTRLANDGPVTLALEMPRQEQQRIDDFFESDGSRRATSRLLAGEFWQVPAEESDGRRSKAMLALLDAIRELRLKGGAVDVVTLDDFEFYAEGSDRRQRMADRITGIGRALEKGPVLILLGNFHARLTPFTGTLLSDGRSIEPRHPTASLVHGIPISSLNVTACGGASWSCREGKCGPMEVGLPSCEDQSIPKLKRLDPSRDGYHYSLTLPELTPSAPAR